MVVANTFSLAYIQTGSDEIETSDGELCSRWLIAAGIKFSSTTALIFADLKGLPSNNTMGPLQDVKLNHDEGNREGRPGRLLTTRE